jgi:hypothetical protein
MFAGKRRIPVEGHVEKNPAALHGKEENNSMYWVRLSAVTMGMGGPGIRRLCRRLPKKLSNDVRKFVTPLQVQLKMKGSESWLGFATVHTKTGDVPRHFARHLSAHHFSTSFLGLRPLPFLKHHRN